MKAWLGWRGENGIVVREENPYYNRRVLVTEWPEGAPEDCPLPGERVIWTGLGKNITGTVRTHPRASLRHEWVLGVEWDNSIDEVWYKPLHNIAREPPTKHYRATYPAASEAEARERYWIPEGVTLEEVE